MPADGHILALDQGTTSTRAIVFRTPALAPVAAAQQELEAKGVEFGGEPFDTGVCHMAVFHDPDGNTLMLHRNYTR